MSDHAALLRRAAARVRETAQPYSPSPFESPFELADRLDELGLNPRLPASQAMATQMLQREQAPRHRDGKFMLAVADWLDQHAEHHDYDECTRETCHAEAAARALLGEDPR